MALPPRGDPQRPLFLAIRSMRLLGILLLAISFLFLFVVVRGRSLLNVIVMIGLFYFMPGVLYLVCAIFLKRRQPWAIVVGLTLASVQMLLIVVAAVTLFAVTALGDSGSMIRMTVMVLLLGAFGQLIFHLCKSFEAIRHSRIEQRGFEPLMMQPIPPAPSQS
jgi:cytochrome bd-type quinol oxidase subunit 1